MRVYSLLYGSRHYSVSCDGSIIQDDRSWSSSSRSTFKARSPSCVPDGKPFQRVNVELSLHTLLAKLTSSQASYAFIVKNVIFPLLFILYVALIKVFCCVLCVLAVCVVY